MRKVGLVGVVALLVVAAVACRKDFDFDADGKADKIFLTSANGDWYRLNPSPDPPTFLAAGQGPWAPGDYDGDGKWEPAAVGGSTWWSQTAGTQTWAPPSCAHGQIDMVQADYDGDGKTDPAFYCQTDATWLIKGQAPVQFGTTATNPGSSGGYGSDADYPVPADYDGDGKADLATYNPRTAAWRVRSSKTGAESTVVVGTPGGWPAPADYDGDGKADRAVAGWGGTWTVEGQPSITFPVPTGDWWPSVADYDGDKKADLSWVDLDLNAVRPPSNWHIRSSQTGITTVDVIPAASTDYTKSLPAEMDYDIVIQTARFNLAVKCAYDATSC